jgi:L,D-transpeptidase catalytic domain
MAIRAPKGCIQAILAWMAIGTIAAAVAVGPVAPASCAEGTRAVYAVGQRGGDTSATRDRRFLPGVTYARAPSTLYAPLRPLAESLDLTIEWDAEAETVRVGGREMPPASLRRLPDGTRLIPVRALEEWDARVSWEPASESARVTRDESTVWVRRGAKRVAVNRRTQRMRAWQGDLLVIETRVSTGRRGMATPTGSFTAGPLKRRMLISHKYDDAEMPWSVQVSGDIVIHGYHSIPPRAASHGCVRVPLTGQNPARWFYRWVEVGTPITILDGWPREARQARS